MQAAYYERQGAARDVLQWGKLPDPVPGPGEVRVRLRWSGVNPSDVKSRRGLRGGGMPFPRIIPHSDGMGVIDQIGAGVSAQRLGQRRSPRWRRGAGHFLAWPRGDEPAGWCEGCSDFGQTFALSPPINLPKRFDIKGVLKWI
jgi:NADPH:quinone reductase-like Zn-dependent oxidoreductase